MVIEALNADSSGVYFSDREFPGRLGFLPLGDPPAAFFHGLPARTTDLEPDGPLVYVTARSETGLSSAVVEVNRLTARIRRLVAGQPIFPVSPAPLFSNSELSVDSVYVSWSFGDAQIELAKVAG